jgi:hypothetical protein
MEEFREIEFEGVMLRVYKTGEIWRWIDKNGPNKIYNPYWKKITKLINSGYVCAIGFRNKKNYLCHRIIAMVYLGLDITDKTQQVDHIDRCRTNNNVCNLRLVTQSQNNFNTGAKGYYFNKRSKSWCVQISVNCKRVYQKYWKTEEDAASDYIKQKEIYHKID